MATVKSVFCIAMLCIFFVSGFAVAESVWFEDSGTEWQETLWYPHKDDPSYHPGASDEASIGYGRTAYIRSLGNLINAIGIGAAGQGGNALYIESGDLTVGNKIEMKSNPVPDLIEISGGALSVNTYVNCYNSTSIFRVVGTDATLSGSAHFNAGGIVEFVIDSTGVTQIPWNIGFLAGGSLSLKSDGALPGTYKLFGGSVNNPFGVITDEPGEGLYWVVQDSVLWADGTITLAEATWASKPDPADEELYVTPSKTLSWDAPAPGVNPNPVYDIYFGTDANSLANPVKTGSSDKFYQPELLENGTTYYWKVDVQGNVENEELWSFTTEPLKAINPAPKHLATGIAPDVVLSWDAPSSAANPSFEVYLSKSPSDPAMHDANDLELVYSGTDKTFNPTPDLYFSRVYKWRVDIADGGETYQGQDWIFDMKNPAGLALEWKMDETSGSVVPDTAGSSNGTAVNSPEWVSGIDGNCLKFNDNGDSVSKFGASGLPTGGSDSWSINMYLFLEKPFAGWRVLGGFGLENPGGGKGRFIMNMNNVITFFPQGAPIKSGTGFDVGWWQMITATYDGTTLRMYKNGIEIASQDMILFDADPEVWLSPLDVWGQGHVDGKIDEFTIWDDALTQSELDVLASNIPVRGDMDADGDVEIDDLKAFMAAWMPIVGVECVGGSVAGDFNGDCRVNLADFNSIAEVWMK